MLSLLSWKCIQNLTLSRCSTWSVTLVPPLIKVITVSPLDYCLHIPAGLPSPAPTPYHTHVILNTATSMILLKHKYTACHTFFKKPAMLSYLIQNRCQMSYNGLRHRVSPGPPSPPWHPVPQSFPYCFLTVSLLFLQSARHAFSLRLLHGMVLQLGKLTPQISSRLAPTPSSVYCQISSPWGLWNHFI